jgi:hypothetical protein
MSDLKEILPEWLEKRLKGFRAVPSRNIQSAASGRRLFIQNAHGMVSSVPFTPHERLNSWIVNMREMFMRKENAKMLQVLATIMIILTVGLGGSGITVAAAQASLPDELLYPVKLLSEEIQQDFTPEESQWETALHFADRRMSELTQMVLGGDTPPESLQALYQSQVENAVKLTANLPEEIALVAREQIRMRLLVHEQMMTQLMAQAPAEGSLLQIREMIQTRIQWVEGVPPGASPEPGAGPIQTENPGNGAGPDNTNGTDSGNPWTTEIPTPGSSYGPGDGDGVCDTCTPNGGESNPWTTEIPTPGSSYGPGTGDGTCTTCTPQSGNGTGPQATPVPGGKKP